MSRLASKTGDGGTTSIIGGRRLSKASQQIISYGELDELNSCIGYLRALCVGAFGGLNAGLPPFQNGDARCAGAATSSGSSPDTLGEAGCGLSAAAKSSPAAQEAAAPELCAYEHFLEAVQRNIFKLGSLLSFDFESGETYKYAFITEADLQSLEKELDDLEAKVAELRNFILPYGSQIAAYAHVVRTVCRRSERALVFFLSELREKKVSQENEALFALALRYINRLSDFFFAFARFANKVCGVEDLLL